MPVSAPERSRMDFCLLTRAHAHTYTQLVNGYETTAQSHRQPVKLFEGSANVIPQLYQSHRSAQRFITDQKGQTGKRKGGL